MSQIGCMDIFNLAHLPLFAMYWTKDEKTGSSSPAPRGPLDGKIAANAAAR